MKNKFVYKVTMGKICIGCCIAFFILLFINNQLQNSNKDTNETVVENTTVVEEISNLATELEKETALPDNYVKVDSWVKYKTMFGSRSDNEPMYFVGYISFAPLIHEDNAVSLEYSLENCIGKFMDTNSSDPLLKVVNEPYLIKADEQEGLYFSVYYSRPIEDHNKTYSDAKKYFEGIILNVKVLYRDGKIEDRKFTLRLSSKYNYELLDFYEIK